MLKKNCINIKLWLPLTYVGSLQQDHKFRSKIVNFMACYLAKKPARDSHWECEYWQSWEAWTFGEARKQSEGLPSPGYPTIDMQSFLMMDKVTMRHSGLNRHSWIPSQTTYSYSPRDKKFLATTITMIRCGNFRQARKQAQDLPLASGLLYKRVTCSLDDRIMPGSNVKLILYSNATGLAERCSYDVRRKCHGR